MSDDTEAAAVAELARQATEAKEIHPAEIYTIPAEDGALRVVDTDEYAASPRRAKAARTVADSASFAAYVKKHGVEHHTEVFADIPSSTIVGIIDSHGGIAGGENGWQSHRVTLTLDQTKSWKAWISHNNTWFTQTDFAEFIEQRATDVIEPTSGDLMSLAQEFYMTKGVEYESSQRLADGQTTLVYKEKVATKGNGSIEVPKELKLALQPYVGGVRQYCFASFRTRLNGSNLEIGYVLIRPEEIVEGAFADIVAELTDGRPDPDPSIVPLPRPGFAPIGFPIFSGKP